jgi:glycosyltransferase involved in cell wall biosynthesis
MKILQIINYYYPSVEFGGPVQCAYNISKYMVKKGHEVTVYATDVSDRKPKGRLEKKFQVIDGTKVFFFPYVSRKYGWLVAPGLIRALRSTINDFDVVHLHEYRTFSNLFFYSYSNKREHVPYILSAHGELEYTYKQRPEVRIVRSLYGKVFGQKLVKHANKLLALTELEYLQFLRLGVEKERITVIPNAINPGDFLNLPPKGTFRQLFDLGKEKIVLFVGRLDERKGIDTLILAFSSLAQKESLKLVLAGQDFGYLAILKKLVSDLNLNNRVVFTGPLNRQAVIAAYNDASIVVYATHSEGFPLVPLEAGVIGKPIIVSNHPSMDFVRKGNFGLFVDYGNVSQLKETIETILNDAELAEELVKNGKRFVRENYSWEIIASKIEDAYSQVIA